jgi:hypothetical protein
MKEGFSENEIIVTLPERPLFRNFLESLRAAGVSADVEGGILKVETDNQNVEYVRRLVRALLGEECGLDILDDDEVKKMHTPLEELDISYRGLKSLKNRGYYTVGDIVYRQAGHPKNFGNTTERELRIALFQLGIEVGTFFQKNADQFFPMSKLNRQLPKGVCSNALLETMLKPLSEKIPDYVVLHKRGEKTLVKIHVKLANKIIVNCSTLSELESFIEGVLNGDVEI